LRERVENSEESGTIRGIKLNKNIIKEWWKSVINILEDFKIFKNYYIIYMKENLFSVNNIVSYNSKGDVLFNNHSRDQIVRTELRINIYYNLSSILLWNCLYAQTHQQNKTVRN
jgi:hypothetical protein